MQEQKDMFGGDFFLQKKKKESESKKPTFSHHHQTRDCSPGDAIHIESIHIYVAIKSTYTCKDM